jgi:hypothetical protein
MQATFLRARGPVHDKLSRRFHFHQVSFVIFCLNNLSNDITRKSPPSAFSHSRYDVPQFFSTVTIPLAMIYKIYCAPPRNSVYIVCKDYRVVQFTLSGFLNNRSKVDTFMQLISGLAFMVDNEPKLHFFAYKFQTTEKQSHGWQFSDLIKEYVRQGVYDLPEWKVIKY